MTLYLQGPGALCIIMCLWRVLSDMKAFPHSLHRRDFSPLSFFSCFSKKVKITEDSAKYFTLMCFIPLYFSYSEGLCPEWHLVCLSLDEWFMKIFPYTLYSHGFTLEVFFFKFRFGMRLKFFPHWLPSLLSQRPLSYDFLVFSHFCNDLQCHDLPILHLLTQGPEGFPHHIATASSVRYPVKPTLPDNHIFRGHWVHFPASGIPLRHPCSSRGRCW